MYNIYTCIFKHVEHVFSVTIWYVLKRMNRIHCFNDNLLLLCVKLLDIQ